MFQGCSLSSTVADQGSSKLQGQCLAVCSTGSRLACRLTGANLNMSSAGSLGQLCHGQLPLAIVGHWGQRLDLGCRPIIASDECRRMQGAWDSYAMGNYPWPSSYIGGSAEHPLPAWPMRAACSHLAAEEPSDDALLEVCPDACSSC